MKSCKLDLFCLRSSVTIVDRSFLPTEALDNGSNRSKVLSLTVVIAMLVLGTYVCVLINLSVGYANFLVFIGG